MARIQTIRKKPTRKNTKSTTRKKKGVFANVILPLAIIILVVFAFGYIFLLGVRTVTATSFFDLKKVDVIGASEASRAQVEKILVDRSDATGVWNADIEGIKAQVEELKLVKAARISRVLPNKIRAAIDERIPKAVVRIEKRDYWVDEDAVVLRRIVPDEKLPPFTMFGWQGEITKTAIENNKRRVGLFERMRAAWEEFDLSDRVSVVDLANLNNPRAIVADSGETVSVLLGAEDFQKRLKTAIENLIGHGKTVKSIDVRGSRPIIEYRSEKTKEK